MSRALIHLADYDHDELVIGRRGERDREREGVHLRRRGEPGRTRRRWLQMHVSCESIQLACPSCRGPVYVPADSDDERVDCTNCDARLTSRRALDGSVELAVIDPLPGDHDAT